MNTLDDLRVALQRAGTFDDVEGPARPLAVRRRVSAVRRRRAATAVATAVVVVLAVVAGGTLLGGGGSTVEPTRRLDVPAQVRLSGFPYALTRVAHPRDGQRVSVGGDVTGRAAVLVAHGLGSGTATLVLEGQPIARLVRDGRSAPVPLLAGSARDQMYVALDGAPRGARVGIALYDRTGELADGVSNGETVFREQVGAMVRVDAGFAAPGARGLDLTVRAPLRDLRFRTYCSADQPRLWVQVSIDGDVPSGTECAGNDGIDGGATSLGAIGGDAGSRVHTVHVFLTRGRGLDPVSDPRVSYGVGAYVPATGTVEYLGRTWALDDVRTARATDIRTGGEERLLRVVADGVGGTATLTGRLDERRRTFEVHDLAAGPTVDGTLLLPGDTYHLELDVPARIEVYRPE